jgi:hypothetical protein
MLRAACLGSAIVAAAVLAGVARADGLPVLGVDVGPVGVVSTSGAARYVTLPDGIETVVARVRTAGGRVLTSAVVDGNFTIPAVAYDGSASGLSADGSTLVLIEPRAAFPRTETTLKILDARGLRTRSVVRLEGDFSFDAVSPHGSSLYLVQYTSRTDPTRYRVRAYDVDLGRLLAAPVVDPHERGEQMRGSPLSRATSADGRWAYTLYDGAGGTPFVHALDTVRRTARCIDLDALRGNRYLWQLRLKVDGSKLTVRNGHETEAVVNLRTFSVGKPSETLLGLGWPAALVAILVVAALAVSGAAARTGLLRPCLRPLARRRSASP